MSKKQNLYLGKAGEFAIISEFLCRGLNVAIPEVDVGDDVFVVRDDSGEYLRVQVKTATGSEQKAHVKAQFRLSLRQLATPFTPELVYVFVVRMNEKWLPFVLIPRDQLYEMLVTELPTDAPKAYTLNLTFTPTRCFSGKLDLTPYINDFEKFPTIFH